ncbi:hypothetical protein Tco_0884530 [Tanacetum coccineum]
MERAATTTSSLVAKQDSGNINRTQSMATLNESFPQVTGSGSGPRCQDTILGGAEAQIRFEAASKQSNDPPLLRVNTLGSGEDSMKLMELMEHYTKLFELLRKRNKRYEIRVNDGVLKLMLLSLKLNAAKLKLMLLATGLKHNMVAYLEKSKGSEGFPKIIDFLSTSHIHYAFTVSPTIYTSLIEQFWQTAALCIIDDRVLGIQTTLIRKVRSTVSKASLESIQAWKFLKIPSLPTQKIFEQMAIMCAGQADQAVDQPSLSEPLLSSSHPPVLSATTESEPTPIAEQITHPTSLTPEPDSEPIEHTFEQPSPEHQPFSPR